MVVVVNLATFYLVGISTAVFLEFRMKLYATVRIQMVRFFFEHGNSKTKIGFKR